VTREVITHCVFAIPDNRPKKCCGKLLSEIWDIEAEEIMFIMPVQTQQTHVQRLSPENKGVSPYIPLQAHYRGNKIKKQGLTHIWLHATL
jgi:hypothetical protein